MNDKTRFRLTTKGRAVAELAIAVDDRELHPLRAIELAYEAGRLSAKPLGDVVYLAHPYGGDICNLSRAKRWLRWAHERFPEMTIIAPWIPTCEVLDDADQEQRERSLEHDCAVVARCDEIWLVGGTISDGMRQEAETAMKYGVKVVDMTRLGPEPPKGDDDGIDRCDVPRGDCDAGDDGA